MERAASELKAFDTAERFLRYRFAMSLSLFFLLIGFVFVLFGATGDITITLYPGGSVTTTLPGVVSILLGYLTWWGHVRNPPDHASKQAPAENG